MKVNFSLNKKLFINSNKLFKLNFFGIDNRIFYKNIANFNFMTLNKLKYNVLSINKQSNLITTKNTYNSINLNNNSFVYVQSMFLRSLYTKRNKYLEKNKNYKMKDRKSLRKRIKIVGPSYERMFAFRRVGFRHKRTKKTNNNKSKPKFKLLSCANRSYITRNLPYFKFKRVKIGRNPY